MRPAQFLCVASLSLASPVCAEGVSVSASAFADFVAYADDKRGQGARDLNNPNGIFNVDNDAAGGGHEHGGGLVPGLNFRGAELALRAHWSNVGDGVLRITASKSDAAIEEVWLRTAPLPGDLRLKAGRYFSATGLQNALHPHEWDFVDQALPYQLLYAGGLRGDGAQLEWQPGAALRIGAEAMTGGNAGVSAYVGSTSGYVTSTAKTVTVPFSSQTSWPAVISLYAKGERALGEQDTLSWGLFSTYGRQHQELHRFHPGINDADHALQGSTRTHGASLAFQHEGNGAHGAGDVALSAEYFDQTKDLILSYHDTKPWNVGMPRELHVNGAVFQALYGIVPRWQVGLRYDMAGNIHEAIRSASPVNCLPPYQAIPCARQTSSFAPVQRISAALTWAIDDRQQLRLQVSQALVPVAEDVNGDGQLDAINRRSNQVFLQYQISLGRSGGRHVH